jgi:pimeloyl-ACP methyl ester carboxylesterase
MTSDLATPELHRTGTGPPVVLLHPLGVDHSVWEPVSSRLPGFTLLSYDLPGHGDTPPPDRRCTVDDLADQLADLLGAQGMGPASVVGVSLGGLVAQSLAARHPGSVDHLVVVDAVDVYPPAMRAMWRDRAALVRSEGMAPVVRPTLELWFTAAALEPPQEVVRTVERLLLAADPEGYARACEVLESADTAHLLTSVEAPTLVVCGEDDAPPFVAAAPRLAETVKNGRLVWLDHARHAGALERPAAFADLLAAFLPAASSR